MAKRWSKLQKEIYNLMDDSINIQIHCSVYRMDTWRGCTDLPRYWITLYKEIIFDYPKQFMDVKVTEETDEEILDYLNPLYYPWITSVSYISDIIRDYNDTPVSELLSHKFEKDYWGITEILKAADRRLGKAKLEEYFQISNNEAAKKVIKERRRIK